MNDGNDQPPSTAREWRAQAEAASTPAAALDAWREYLWLRPDDAGALLVQAFCFQQLGKMSAAVAALQRAARLAPNEPAIRLALARLWLDLAEWDRAAAALSLATGATGAAELTARLGAERGQLSMNYARHLFNDYAPDFDKALERLDYRAPELIFAAVKPFLKPPLTILDLGCGTGLSGIPFKGLAKTLVGVDLAEKMLVQAQARGIYDLLVCGDLLTVLHGPLLWDLIIAADVFVYIENLVPVFSAARKALLIQDVSMAFTVETGPGGPDPVLQDSRRYAHGPACVEKILRETGFKVRARQDASLRRDRGEDVKGQVYVISATI